ncbi:MurR/RpiR family transcriptional regulator [Wansuia hejianensis]|uniref:MurR/RpiR family transcriptional regulator n=1 Tax=Wansuia hejianensis TaxID=2763667 RepID=A0A926IMV7_9FIRM|nr:MurR/RpiR family transcriptional regulator [Wansuia hejianensis]MBC8590053.1 MurR/RpiR family transcriptional regulator [Wansuia hejianensis]
MNSILKIKNLKDSFTDSEGRIADYIIENKEEVCNLTTGELAEITETSPASVIRFAKKLGYSGFQELKIAIAKDTPKYEMDIEKLYEAITLQDATEEIMEKVAIENIKAIKDTITLLNKEIIDISVEAIDKANYVNIFGVGSSGLVGEDLQYKMVRIGTKAGFHPDPHLQIVSASNMQEGDLAIGISHSGRTKETFNALKIAKNSGAKTISITKYGSNPVSDIADIKLYTTEVERHLRMGAISSRIAQLTIIDILFINLVKKNYNKMQEKIIKTGNLIDNLKIN